VTHMSHQLQAMKAQSSLHGALRLLGRNLSHASRLIEASDFTDGYDIALSLVLSESFQNFLWPNRWAFLYPVALVWVRAG
jgi:hypothetical protein